MRPPSSCCSEFLQQRRTPGPWGNPVLSRLHCLTQPLFSPSPPPLPAGKGSGSKAVLLSTTALPSHGRTRSPEVLGSQARLRCFLTAPFVHELSATGREQNCIAPRWIAARSKTKSGAGLVWGFGFLFWIFPGSGKGRGPGTSRPRFPPAPSRVLLENS